MAGDDELIGGGGDDTLTGGTGDDIYAIDRGDGADIIDNAAESSSDDRISFGAGVDQDQLWFRQVGDDLEISIIGTEDSATVEDWYVGTDNRVAEIRTADDHVLTAANVENLVSAMAAFSPPAFGETELSAALHTELDPVIAANWQSGGSA